MVHVTGTTSLWQVLYGKTFDTGMYLDYVHEGMQ